MARSRDSGLVAAVDGHRHAAAATVLVDDDALHGRVHRRGAACGRLLRVRARKEQEDGKEDGGGGSGHGKSDRSSTAAVSSDDVGAPWSSWPRGLGRCRRLGLGQHLAHRVDEVGRRVVGEEGLELDHRPGRVVAVLVEEHPPEEVGVGVGGVDGHGLVERLQRLVGQPRPLEQPAPVGKGLDVARVVRPAPRRRA